MGKVLLKNDVALNAISSANETPPLPAAIMPPPMDLSKMPTGPIVRQSTDPSELLLALADASEASGPCHPMIITTWHGNRTS